METLPEEILDNMVIPELPEDVIAFNILNKLFISDIKSVNTYTYEKYLYDGGKHVYDYSMNGIEFFAKFCHAMKTVIYYKIPKYFLFMPDDPEILYFKDCEDIIDVNNMKNLKRLTIINTDFKPIDLTKLPNLQYVRIELFKKNYDERCFAPSPLGESFIKTLLDQTVNIKLLKYYININGKSITNQ